MASQAALTAGCVALLSPSSVTQTAAIRPRLPARRQTTTRATAEGPRAPARPVAPVAPAPPSTVETATAPSQAPASAQPAAAKGATVSMEFQRQAAKDMVAYFQEKKFEDVSKQERVFGWTRRNEIGNGRWVMFGLLVGLLTEYATGVDFPTQIVIVLENLGVID